VIYIENIFRKNEKNQKAIVFDETVLALNNLNDLYILK
jgi:hypothetical protein